MNQTTIYLLKRDGSWVFSEYINGKPSPKLIELFGTHTLPTAFTDKADQYIVHSEIMRLNPEADVMVVESEI